ncbi:MAG: hypothetical protein ACTSO7_00525 [Candidatus Heimdallarchaeota archaeon]
MKKGLKALFHLTPREPVQIVDNKFEAYLYLHGAYLGPRPRYTLKEQYEEDYAIIRSTKNNQSDITSFYNQGCIRVRFKPKDALIGNGNQIQFIFRVQRKYPEDSADVQVFLWSNKVLQERIQYKGDGEDGEDYVAFITDIPDDNYIEFYLRPYTKEVYTLIFKGVTAYLHD